MSEKKNKKEVFLQKMQQQQSEAKIVRRIVFRIAVFIIIMVSLIVSGGFFYINSALKPVNPESDQKIKIEIPIGSNVSQIAQILEENGIIKDANVFKYYVKLKNNAEFMAGSYNLKPSMQIPEIIESLKTGKVMQEVVFKITIPEGKQLRQIATIIGEKTEKNPKDVFKQLNDETFIKKLINKYPEVLSNEILNKDIKYPLEGYLFPATYPFYEENPAMEDIITVMLDKTKSVLTKYEGQMVEKKFTPHQLLTIASLIEEEATEKIDRNKIASVFYNRLDEGMPLQTDPTVLYAHGEHKERVYYKDLEVESPYNTYKYKGLTPGPIANAGIASIEAALNPANTDFLYFLATASGDVLFSTTLDEHNEKKAEHITNK